MTINEAKKQIIKVIADITEVEEKITEETLIVRDLGLTSIEIISLIGELEDIFDVDLDIRKNASVKTVGQLCQVIIDQLKG